ncbi:MAG: hypothetical protein ACLGSD_01930 [Acidobacteriota bacterium]
MILLAMVLVPAGAQEAAGNQGPSIADGARVENVSMASNDFSQPGARGRLMSVTQPPVPVPPGPVPASKIKPAPPTPIAQKKIELGHSQPWNPQWDVLIEENLPQELLSSQVSQAVHPFCPRFNHLSNTDKRAYWAYFFQALAGAEAGLRPTADVRHLDPTVAVRDLVSHRTVRQEGLLQLTYMDARRYGCNFDWKADRSLPEHDPRRTILQPKNNLLCGIHILEHQLIDKHRPLVTKKSYWGTLHPGTLSYRVFAKQMANVPVACVRPTYDQPSSQPELREAANQPAADSAGADQR